MKGCSSTFTSVFMTGKIKQKNSASTVQLWALKWSYWEYLCKYSWTVDVPDFSFIFPIVYDQCVSTDCGEESKLQTSILCSELEEFDLCSYLVFLCFLIFYRLVPIIWNCWELAVASSAYRQDIYMLLKMNKNLEHLQVLNMCGMQATSFCCQKFWCWMLLRLDLCVTVQSWTVWFGMFWLD